MAQVCKRFFAALSLEKIANKLTPAINNLSTGQILERQPHGSHPAKLK